MSCYDVAKMTSLMRSGIANVYVSFSTKNANLRVIVSQKSCIALISLLENVSHHILRSGKWGKHLMRVSLSSFVVWLVPRELN